MYKKSPAAIMCVGIELAQAFPLLCSSLFMSSYSRQLDNNEITCITDVALKGLKDMEIL